MMWLVMWSWKMEGLGAEVGGMGEGVVPAVNNGAN